MHSSICWWNNYSAWKSLFYHLPKSCNNPTVTRWLHLCPIQLHKHPVHTTTAVTKRDQNIAQIQEPGRDYTWLDLLTRYSSSCAVTSTEAISLSRHPCIITVTKQKDETNLKGSLALKGEAKPDPGHQVGCNHPVFKISHVIAIHYKVHMQIGSMNFILGLL